MQMPHAAAALACLATACVQPRLPEAARPAAEAGVVLASNSVTPSAGETRFSAVRQLTAGGQNAEAYFSRDGRWLTFQSAQLDYPCDQQYVMRLDGSGLRRVSDGRGKTTCGWFFAGGERLFFGSTTAHQDRCPPKPDASAGYVWPLDPYDIYAADRDGTNLKRLTLE